MCNVVLVHELYGLCRVHQRGLDKTEVRSAHFEDLPEKLHSLADCLETGVVKWTQKRHDEYRIAAHGQFENVQQWYCMVFWIRSEMRRAQELEDLTLIVGVAVDWNGFH